MAQLMRSPEGEEHEIADGGVAALVQLGWEKVEQPKAQKAAKKAAEKPSDKK